MAQIQALHFCIDDRTLLIPILVLPVQIWLCKNWTFEALVRCSDHAGTDHAPSNRSIYIKYVHSEAPPPVFVVRGRTRTMVVHKGQTINFFLTAINKYQCVKVFCSIVIPQVAERSLEKFSPSRVRFAQCFWCINN